MAGRLSQTVMDPQSLQLAKVYADAMLSLLPDDKQAQEVSGELQTLADLVRDTPGALELLTNPLIHGNDCVELLDRLFKGKVGDKTYNLLLVMGRNGRIGLLSLVARQLQVLLNERMNLIEVFVTSAVELGEDIKRQLAEILRRRLNKEPLIETHVDPRCLGGMIIHAADRRFDTSVAARLRDIRRNLVER